MTDIHLQVPDAFDFSNPNDWSHWKQQFQQFRIALSRDTQPTSKQVGTPLGVEAEVVLSSTGITDAER